MKIEVLDKKGKKVEDLELDEKIFGADVNEALITQYVNVYRSNQRQGTSASKTRSEVSGGGKKPWRQKGTGRARHGSIRSPIWVGGGVAHGPKPKSWKLNMSKTQKRQVVISALSVRQSGGNMKVLSAFDIKKPKTKEMVDILENLDLYGKTLVVIDKQDNNVLKSASNLRKVKVTSADNLNAYNILEADNILFLKKALDKVQKRLSK